MFMIMVVRGQRYTLLPETRGEVKQNMKLHGFTGRRECIRGAGLTMKDAVAIL
jgi:hypothetical protein